MSKCKTCPEMSTISNVKHVTCQMSNVKKCKMSNVKNVKKKYLIGVTPGSFLIPEEDLPEEALLLAEALRRQHPGP